MGRLPQTPNKRNRLKPMKGIRSCRGGTYFFAPPKKVSKERRLGGKGGQAPVFPPKTPLNPPSSFATLGALFARVAASGSLRIVKAGQNLMWSNSFLLPAIAEGFGSRSFVWAEVKGKGRNLGRWPPANFPCGYTSTGVITPEIPTARRLHSPLPLLSNSVDCGAASRAPQTYRLPPTCS